MPPIPGVTGSLDWPILITSGVINTAGWVMFIFGKRQQRHNLMIAGAGLFGCSIFFSDSWLWLILSTAALAAVAWFWRD